LCAVLNVGFGPGFLVFGQSLEDRRPAVSNVPDLKTQVPRPKTKDVPQSNNEKNRSHTR
jgi:hypothetical protein